MELLKLISDKNKKKVVVHIDPDKYTDQSVLELIEVSEKCKISFFLIGSSLVSKNVDHVIQVIKSRTRIPVILFPGSLLQISLQADGILLLSLISGRNPEYLIGNHIIAATFLKKSNLEIIPTGYILVENGHTTSVEYVSNTKPIPSDKKEIAVATAIAGEMLGLKLIYLEGGSGADHHVPLEMIKEVKKNISIPLIVGGGIRTSRQIKDIFEAGANVVVIGNVIEKNPQLLSNLLK